MHALTTQQQCIGERSNKNARITGKGRQRANALWQISSAQPTVIRLISIGCFCHHRQRQMGQQALAYTHWPSTRSAAAVRRGKGFVQVHVQHIKTHIARLNLTQNCIEVCAIVIEQPSGAMDSFSDLFNLTLKHTAGRRVSHHQTGRLRSDTGPKCCQIYIAVGIHRHFSDFISAHNRGGGIRAMGRIGDDNLGTRFIASRLVISSNHCNACKLALGTRHRCQRYTLHSRDVP